ncbi:MAG: FAD-binding oxidoreductase [Gemmatimonadota bacterium]|jgi:FAD/FMN-containing dehydrogenase
MTPSSGTAPAWQELDSLLDGDVVLPGDDRYPSARKIWNARLDRRPAGIARCVNAGDVQAALDFARDAGLVVAVRGGGHDYSGHSTCEGGLVIDLAPLKEVSVDPEGRTVRVGPGATWADVDGATQEYGLATPGGTVSSVGVGGLTLGGGAGHLSRLHGLTIDNLLAAEVITPDRGPVRASEDENPDLFWALRGGGGNFGVVTAFEYRLHEVGPEVLAAQLIFPYGQATSVIRAWSTFMAGAPDALAGYAFIFRLPPDPAFPEEHHGRPVVDLVLVYAGDPAEGEALIRPLRAAGDPILDAVGAQSYVSVQQTFDAGVPAGLRWYSKAHDLAALHDEAIETMVHHCRDLPGTTSMVYLVGLGGALARVAPDATAFPHREALFNLHILPGWSDPGEDERIVEWARTFHGEMARWSTGGTYVNLLAGDEGGPGLAAWGDNYPRLRKIKARWDRQNLLRMNHNIPPAV